MKRLHSLLLLLAIALMQAGIIQAQDREDTSEQIFNPAFRSLKTSVENNFMAQPVIHLGSDEKIVISFDELTDEASYLRAMLIHCNADWQPSNLVDSEFIDGFNETEIDDYAFSQNTFIHYVNYRLTIPSENLRPTRSGNYLLQVYNEDDPDIVILQTRFSISESRLAVDGFVTGRTDRGYNDSWQQLELKIDAGDYPVRDPFSDIIVEISQNGNPESIRHITRPLRIDGKTLIYEHSPELIFPAGNEFRRFETVRADYPGLGVDSVRFENGIYHAYLTAGHKRLASNYSYDRTQHGRFLIREYNSTDSDLGADYISVHFRLDAPKFTGADVYVDSEMTSHNLSSRYKMEYNPDIQAYTLTLPLKQGSYNYRYIALPAGYSDAKPDAAPIEGDFYETRNEYRIKIFQREPGARADRLIGDKIIYSY